MEDSFYKECLKENNMIENGIVSLIIGLMFNIATIFFKDDMATWQYIILKLFMSIFFIFAGYMFGRYISRKERFKIRQHFANRIKMQDGYDNHNFDDSASILLSNDYRVGRDEKTKQIWNTIDRVLEDLNREDS